MRRLVLGLVAACAAACHSAPQPWCPTGSETPLPPTPPPLRTVQPGDDYVDIAISKTRFDAFTDGHGHFLVFSAPGRANEVSSSASLFYGDATTLYAVPLIADEVATNLVGGACKCPEGTACDWNTCFADAALEPGTLASFYGNATAATLVCGARPQLFTALPAADRDRLLAGARIRGRRWHAVALARMGDDAYVYVDKTSEAPLTRDAVFPDRDDRFSDDATARYRIFAGEKGSMRPIGDFSSHQVLDDHDHLTLNPSGRLLHCHYRALVPKSRGCALAWEEDGGRRGLVSMAISTNERLIHDIGVYRLAPSPCSTAP